MDLDDPLSLPADDVPYEGVPAFLEQSLRAWIKDALESATDVRNSGAADQFAEIVALRLWMSPAYPAYGLTGHQTALCTADRRDLLRVVNAILRFASPTRMASLIARLELLLVFSGSAYEIETGSPTQLVRRVDPSVRDAVRKAQDQAEPTAAQHLRAAWVAAYGVEPEPNVAYAEAVRAVEAVACPLLVPNPTRPPTLGTVLTLLRGDAQATTPKWELVIPDQHGAPSSVAPIVGMIELLWHGHRSRHAGSESARPNTLEEAEAAYMLAATLVHWLSKGALRPRS
ncbi:hypothetical protein [Micromonospora chalcea]|uniref:hypothetical protein n=1 Tax=Micromonospora chalcea TaxID=1874 RepID=UPI00332F24E4